jgi:hypothetical protein
MDIYKRALEHYGIKVQTEIFIEECVELIAGIQRYKRGRLLAEDLAEESADVIILSRQLVAVRPLRWGPVPVPVDLKQARDYLCKAVWRVCCASAPSSLDIGTAWVLSTRATDYLTTFSGPENVKSWIKTKLERLERRMEEDNPVFKAIDNDPTEKMSRNQDCNC